MTTMLLWISQSQTPSKHNLDRKQQQTYYNKLIIIYVVFPQTKSICFIAMHFYKEFNNKLSK